MNNPFMKFFSFFIILSFYIAIRINAQPSQILNSSELKIALEKLNVLGSVLYIGAHPDDENSGIIAYWAKGKKYRTAYLSLTRGDGGQNLIGSEKGSEIGIIRTQELLQARKIDGGEQYFTRAIDFGYSKSPEESLNIWGKNDVLSDMVWVIRKFKPDIIVTRFPPGGNGGHGHHTASAALSLEAFNDAADPTKFTEQLKYVSVWKTKRIFWNNFRPSPDEINNLISTDIGEYNPLLGKSYTEIASESRSMHKSQGVGVSAFRGSRIEYFKLVAGEDAKNDIFDGINTTWDRIDKSKTLSHNIESVIKSFNPDNPSASLDALIKVYDEITKLSNNYWVEVKSKELLSIIQSCAGLWLEAISSDYSASSGDSVKVKTTVLNRSSSKFIIDKIEFPSIPSNSIVNKDLKNNLPVSVENSFIIPESYPISQPYWLKEKPSEGLFSVSDQQMIGLAENPPSIPVKIFIKYNDTLLDFSIPLLYRWNDRVYGELYRPFEIRPVATVNPADKVSIFPDEKSKEIQVKLKANSSNISGLLNLHSDGNWKISPSGIPFSIKNKYDEQIITFTVTPPENPGVADLKIELIINGKTYNKSLVEISYPHIKRQVYFPDSDIKLVKLDIKKFNSNIAYIMGSGDEIPECLSNMGYSVTLLSDEMLDNTDLSQFDAVIAGIRSYNTRERLKYDQPRLLEYVKNGGTFIVQYNIPFGLQTDNIGPYPIKLGNERITDENAFMNFINPDNQLLNFPNKITQMDFKGWIQERGLYFAENWDDKYEPVLSGHDPNEKDLKGSMLFTHYGKGIFIFSAIAWFRQLPAGVPGAYRIFVNMISAGKYDKSR